LGTHLSEIKHTANFDLIGSKDRVDLEVRVTELERLVDKLSNSTNPDDPLLALPKSKQNTYREIFDLIYECSANRIAAKSLIDRILSRISKS